MAEPRIALQSSGKPFLRLQPGVRIRGRNAICGAISRKLPAPTTETLPALAEQNQRGSGGLVRLAGPLSNQICVAEDAFKSVGVVDYQVILRPPSREG